MAKLKGKSGEVYYNNSYIDATSGWQVVDVERLVGDVPGD